MEELLKQAYKVNCKAMKLTSIQEHSDDLNNRPYTDMSERWYLHRQRVKFGRQKLELWMFVPCKFVDGVWVVLEEPKWVSPEGVKWEDFVKEYQEAKERILFEGFEVNTAKTSSHTYRKVRSKSVTVSYYNDVSLWSFEDKLKTIEDLVKYNLVLTPTAQKQIS